MFLGGSSSMRPFGTAILDGVDLDIEKGTTTGYTAFVNTLRNTYFNGASKKYYISSAPQCVYPDEWLGPNPGTAFENGWFDYVWVQFYNNYCGVDAYPSQFNFNTWATWATTTSLNPDVKIFVGAGADFTFVGTGYVNLATLQTIAGAVGQQHANVFGGVMLWDASSAAINPGFASGISSFLKGVTIPSSSSTSTSTSTTKQHASSSSTTTSTSTSSSSSGAKHVTTYASKHSSTSSSTSTTAAVQDLTTAHSNNHLTTAKKQHSSSSSSSSTSADAASQNADANGSSSSTSTTGNASENNTPIFVEPCVSGYMTCATSETYRICDRGVWATAQSCQTGLQCTPAGNYIYCE